MSKTELYPWQSDLWQRLYAMRERWPHALLLTGQAGIGKLQLARVVAAWKLCQQPTEQGACWQCHACQLILQGNHPDLIEVAPEESAQGIKIDQVRTLVSRLQSTPAQGLHQVVILHPAESMNRAASNALLKTLEEPSGDITLMLISLYAQRLPVTITSRCQELQCPTPQAEQVLPWLQVQCAVDAGQAQALLVEAADAPLVALAQHASEIGKSQTRLIEMLSANTINPLQIAEQIQMDYAGLLDSLQMLVLRLMREKIVPNTDPTIASMRSLNALPSYKLLKIYDRLCQSRRDLASNPAAHKTDTARYRILSEFCN